MTNLPLPALRNTVQEFPPPDNTGTFYGGMYQRGPILPPYGTKDRDRILRVMHRSEFNGIWQGATAGLIKRIKSTQWEIRIQDSAPEMRTLAQSFEQLFQEAQFGQGWGVWVSRILEDYLTQDYGAFIELIGAGDPSGPLMGPIVGIGHLDSMRVYVTGNPLYPVLYYSLMTGKLHKIHHTRLARIVDMPNPDERYFNIGLCALSRAIAVVQREIRMGRYIDGMLDDKPKPGIALVTGMTEQQRRNVLNAYFREQQSDERPEWGRVVWFHSINVDLPIDIKTLPFVQTPEQFDFKVYTELDVNAVALALGVDRQELWELQGKAVGSSAQSQVLAQKSQGKAYADMLKTIERLINLTILPPGLEFRFKFRDAFADKAQAQIDAQSMQIAQGMASIPNAFTVQEIRDFLANKSDSFKDAFSTESGQVGLPDDDRLPANANPTISAPPLPPNVIDTRPNQSPPSQPRFAGSVIPSSGKKSFRLTTADWRGAFRDAVQQYQQGTYNDRQLYALLYSELQDYGELAYKDGLYEGNVQVTELTDAERSAVLDWLSDQTDYLKNFVAQAATLPPEQIDLRAEMWARKSLGQMFSAGRLRAQRDGMYEFVGTDGSESCDTCQRLKGQVHRYSDWVAHQLVPNIDTDSYICKGFKCQHFLRLTPDRERGAY